MIRHFMEGFKAGMGNFGSNISTIVNSVLLLIVYVLGVGITSITAKISGKKFLDNKLSENKETYWSDLNLKRKPIKDYYRQF